MDRLRQWIAVACYVGCIAALTACGDDDGMTDTDAGTADGGMRDDASTDVCAGRALCDTEGRSCAGDVLVTCAEDADGCLVETRMACTGNAVCEASGSSAACVDPCASIPAAMRCDTDGARSCAGDTLEVCAPNGDGCLVLTETDCAAAPGGVCNPSGGTSGDMPVCAMPADPCADVPAADRCTTEGTSCDGDSLVDCAPNAFGCLVRTTTDCTSRDGGACDDSGAAAICTATDACAGVTQCSLEGTSCGGPYLVTCAPDAFGCLVETAVDCTTAPFGFCDADATAGAVCSTAATDPCMGVTECGTEISRTCTGDTLDVCAPNAFGCFVPESTDCSAADEVCSDAGEAPACVSMCPSAEAIVIDCASGTITGTTAGGPTAFSGNACVTGSGYSGAERVYRFRNTSTEPQNVTIVATRGESDSEDMDLFVIAAGDQSLACTDAELECLDSSRGFGGTETVEFGALPGEMAYVLYDVWSNSSGTAEFTLEVTCAASVCGNGQLEAGETCDDGNTDDADGCSSACTVETGFDCDDAEPTVCTAIVCGDGIVGSTEDCDDGNTNDADGCSSTCTVEAGYLCAGTPSVCYVAAANATCAGATAITADTTITGEVIDQGGPKPAGSGCGGGAGSRTLFYAVTIPAAHQVVADVTRTDFDAVVMEQDACADTGCSDSSDSPERLTLVNTDAAPVTRIFAVRPYYPSGTGTFDVTFTYAALCGNGVIDTGETCDDGNAVDSDGCTACAIDSGYVCHGAPSACVVAAPNATCASAAAITADSTFDAVEIAGGGARPSGTGCGGGAGTSTLYYAVTIPAAHQVVANVPARTFDVVVMEQASCSDTDCTASSDSPERLTLVNTDAAPVTRILAVRPYYSTTVSGTFDLTFTYTALCGNGVVDTGETCDDANAVDGDGCTACAIDSGYICSGAPSLCSICGNGVIDGAETCDDGDAVGSDGCSASCTIESGWICSGEPSVCTMPLVFSATPALAIPDSTAAGVDSTVTVTGCATVAAISLDIDVTHTWRGDLIVTLTGPAGTTRTLWSRSGSSADDLIGNFNGTLAPSGTGAVPMSSFVGEVGDGTWTLNVADNGSGDTGTLESWALNVVCSS